MCDGNKNVTICRHKTLYHREIICSKISTNINKNFNLILTVIAPNLQTIKNRI